MLPLPNNLSKFRMCLTCGFIATAQNVCKLTDTID